MITYTYNNALDHSGTGDACATNATVITITIPAPTVRLLNEIARELLAVRMLPLVDSYWPARRDITGPQLPAGERQRRGARPRFVGIGTRNFQARPA